MEQDFLKEVELEVRDVIRRLSNHPSIVLWSGNNENQVCLQLHVFSHCHVTLCM